MHTVSVNRIFADRVAREIREPACVRLSVERILEIARRGGSDVHELTAEIYRLHAVVRRAALLVETLERARARGAFDITSRNLLAGFQEALGQEPALQREKVVAALAVRCAELQGEPRQAGIRRLPQSTASDLATRRPTPPGREKLFTWKLTPEPGRTDPAWSTTRYRGTALVRALNPVQARALAAQRFAIESSKSPQSPWVRRRLVRCERLAEGDYETVAVPSIVYP